MGLPESPKGYRENLYEHTSLRSTTDFYQHLHEPHLKTHDHSNQSKEQLASTPILIAPSHRLNIYKGKYLREFFYKTKGGGYWKSFEPRQQYIFIRGGIFGTASVR